MAQKPLTCETIGDLDGGAPRAIIDAAIREALQDLDDRGDDGQPRSGWVGWWLVAAANRRTRDSGT